MPLQTIGVIIGVAAVLILLVGIASAVRSRGSVEQRLQTFARAGEMKDGDKLASKK